jgi:hypothetical protein
MYAMLDEGCVNNGCCTRQPGYLQDNANGAEVMSSNVDASAWHQRCQEVRQICPLELQVHPTTSMMGQ